MKVKELIQHLTGLDQNLDITTNTIFKSDLEEFTIIPIQEEIIITPADSLGNYTIGSVVRHSNDIKHVFRNKPIRNPVIGYMLCIKDNITDVYKVIDKRNNKYD